MSTLIDAKNAYELMQRILDGLYKLGDKGNSKGVESHKESWAPAFEACLKILDHYLTGKERQCAGDRQEIERIFDFDCYLVHLSDGGYSRIAIDPQGDEPKKRIFLDYSLSLEHVRINWDALMKEVEPASAPAP